MPTTNEARTTINELEGKNVAHELTTAIVVTVP